MGAATERLALLVTADASQAVRAIGDVGTASGRLADTQPRLSRVGQTLTRTLTPAALGFAAAGAVMFQKFDEGADALRAAGATGDGFVESMKRVGNNVPASLGEVGTAMGELYQRTQLTGKPLEELTQQVLELREVGQNVDVEQLTASMAKSGVAAEDMADALDTMYRVSQITGTSVEKLSTLQEQFGAALDLTGLSMEDQLLLLGQFEKSGVNTSTVMSGLTRSLKDFAAAGKDPAAALNETFEAMRNAGSEAESLAIAEGVFGKSAVEVSAAVRNGTLDLNAMQAALSGNTDSIHDAAAGTRDWQETLSMAQNRLVGVLGPLGQYGMAIGGIAAAAGPVMQGLSKMGSVVSGIGNVADSAASGLYGLAGATRQQAAAAGIATVAIGGLVYGLMEMYETNKQNERVAAGFADQIREGGDAVDIFGQAVSEMLSGDNELRDMLNASGESATSLAAAVAEGGATWDEFRQRLLDTGEASDFGAAKLDQLESVYRKGTSAAVEATTATQNQGTANRQTTQTVEELAEQMSGLTSRIEESRQAQLDLLDAQTGAMFGALDYADQQASTAEAVAALAEVERSGTATTDEKAQAHRDAERAVLDESVAAVELAQSMAVANGQSLTAAQRADVQRQALENLKNKFPELNSQIEGYIQALGRIPLSIQTDVRTSGVVAGGQGGQVIRGAVGIRIPGARGQEFPLIAHGGEQVLNPDDADKWRRGQGSGGGSTVVHTTIVLDGEVLSRRTEEHTRKHSEAQYGIPVGVS